MDSHAQDGMLATMHASPDVALSGVDLAREIAQRTWRFGRTDGSTICRILQLTPGGGVVNYNHPEEASWALLDGCLVFRNEAGETTTRFRIASADRGGLTLLGRRMQIEGEPETHVLEGYARYDACIPARASSHIRASFGRDTDRLVVTLNGRGRTFDGEPRETVFEMSGFGPALGADVVQIAEHGSCCAWYADKVDTLGERLLGLLVAQYRTVVFAGMSAGGFGAVLLAEHVARRRPDLRIVSMSINAQTSLLEQHLGHVLATMDPDMMPLWIAPEAYSHTFASCRDLPAVIRRQSSTRVSHHLFYDLGNPIDRYYAELLSETPRCTLHGVEVGLPHAPSITAIYESRAPHRLMTALLEDA